MLVLLTVVIVNVGADHVVAKQPETVCHAIGFRAVAEVRVANIEIEAQAVEAGLAEEGSQIRGSAHFTGGVLDTDSYADMVGVKSQVLQRTESRITFARVGGFPRSAHVQNHARERQGLRDVYS